MPIGDTVTITQPVSLAANQTLLAPKSTSALPLPAKLQSVTSDNASVLVGCLIAGVSKRFVVPGDVALFVLQNTAGSPQTANITVTLTLLDPKYLGFQDQW